MPSQKRSIPWRQIKTKKQLLGVTIALAFGAGLSPYAPGTAGSVVGLGIIWIMQLLHVPVAAQLIYLAVLTVIGTWSAQQVVNLTKTSDHQSIVIDEVIGMGIGAILCKGNAVALTFSFFFFRFFDVLKLPPVGKIDSWSKKTTSTHPYVKGFGVIADDIVAGLQTLAVMLLLQSYLSL